MDLTGIGVDLNDVVARLSKDVAELEDDERVVGHLDDVAHVAAYPRRTARPAR